MPTRNPDNAPEPSFGNNKDKRIEMSKNADLEEHSEFLLLHRLDEIFPKDTDTGVVTAEAVRIYLGAMMEMVSRCAQPVSVLAVTVETGEEDDSVHRQFGATGVSLIGRAVARCLRQETRLHDVVGIVETHKTTGVPTFLVVCPLLNEAQATNVATRLREEMLPQADNPETPWLTVNIGVAAMAIDTLEPNVLILRSLGALRRARLVKGGCVWRHTQTMRRIAQTHDAEMTEDMD